MARVGIELEPQLKTIITKTQQELRFRMVEQIRAVPDIAGRQAVRKLTATIKDQERKLAPGQMADNYFANLVGIVAADERSGPYLERLLAVMEISRLYRNKLINYSQTAQLWGKLNEAMGTEPFPRGGPIMQGAMEAIYNPNADKHPIHERIGYAPNMHNETEKDQWQRQVMIEVATDEFRNNPDLSMLLPEWRVVSNPKNVKPGGEDVSYGIPKIVLRLKALTRGVRGRSLAQGEIRSHICSEKMQWIAAAKGMPRQDLYDQLDLLDRNPSLVRDFSRNALDEGLESESALRRQGVLIDPVQVLSPDEQEHIAELTKKTGGLNTALIQQNLGRPGALDYILMVRVLRRSRKLSPRDARARVFGNIDLELKRLDKEVEVIEQDDNIENKQKVRIIDAYTRQWNRERGALSSPQIKVEPADVLDSLRVTAAAMLCAYHPNSGEPVLRTEGDLYRLMNERISLSLDPEDVRRFPKLLEQRFSTETIQRRSLPQGAKSPMQFDEEEV